MNLNHMKEMGSSQIFFFVTAITLIMMATVLSSSHFGSNVSTGYTPLVSAAMKIKLHSTTAHLWFEEAISGDQSVDIKDVWDNIDQSEWYAQAMLDGGSNEEGTYVPLEDPNLRLQIKRVIVGIHSFRQIAQKRWVSQGISGVGSNMDQQLDLAFLNFNLSADQTEVSLKKIIAEDLQTFKYIQLISISFIFLLGLVIGGLLLRYNARISQSKLTLLQNEEHLKAVIDNSPACIKLVGRDGALLEMNRAGLAMIGADSLTEATGQSIYSLISSEYRNDYQIFNERICNNESGSMEFGIIGLNGVERLMETHSVPFNLNSTGELAQLAITQDITERKQSEEKLKLSSRVFNNTHEGISIADANMNIVDINPAFCKITGYSREEAIGQNSSILSSGKQSPRFYQDMWLQIDEEGHWQGEIWNRKKDGELYAELLNISVLKDELDNVVNYIGVFTDITSSKKQQEQLQLMAHYDVLTSLPNRALFIDRFHQAIVHSKRTEHQLAIFFLDLDNFKPVNDNYGHDVGDQLLIEVSERIKANIGEEDTVSRQGGDEFTLLLNDIESFTQCEQTLQRIHHALAQPFIIDDYPHKITASGGVTLYPNDDGDIDTLLRHADQAMYQAKLAGKHRYQLFNPEQNELTVQKHLQLAEIEQALINDEFELYYQPKLNMITGDVFGAEALIRWIHPEKGLIPPLDFLPILDGTELELKVGNWVINEAVSQLEAWHKQDIRLEVSVNISSHHLLSETFFADLDSVLTKYPSVDSQCLQLEILESSALGDLNAITSVIKACQGALGITVALDDFGTGYSSLTHLRSLPANTIKIDQSFVRDMLDDPSDSAIIDSIIGLSGSFNREVIAEGVETTDHGLMLLVMGCEVAQGYGIAKPMPADNFPQWLNNYTPNQEWLNCGHKYRTLKENKVKLFRLIAEHWKNRFIEGIQASPEGVERWPIMNSRFCPCSAWIQREIQEKLFEKEGLEQLNETHEVLHRVAHDSILQYQAGNINTARESLPELQAAFDKMNNALGMCE